MHRRTFALSTCLLTALATLSAQPPAPAPQQPAPLQQPPATDRTFAAVAPYLPDMSRLAAATSELRDLVDRFAADRQALQRFHNVPGSNERRARLRAFQQAWLQALPKIDF